MRDTRRAAARARATTRARCSPAPRASRRARRRRGAARLPAARGGRAASLPVDVARTIEEALVTGLPLDFVHVHEPFAPSTSSAALRHSRALNVGTFHAPTERVLSTQVARRVVELVFGRLDARTASFAATRELLRALLPGRLPRSSARGRAGRPPAARARGPAADRLLGEEERAGAAPVPARAAPAAAGRRLATRPCGRRAGVATPAVLRRRAARAGHLRRPARADRGRRAAPRPTSLVSASSGRRARAAACSCARSAAGAVPVAARLPVYEELRRRRRARPALRARRRRDARRPARRACCRTRRCCARLRDGRRAAASAARPGTRWPTSSRRLRGARRAPPRRPAATRRVRAGGSRSAR